MATNDQDATPSEIVTPVFSAASFFDVVRATPTEVGPLTEPDDIIATPAKIAFYGFRGGAGRTLALAHTAVALAARGLRVVAIDLDIEAPGLPTALGISAEDVPGAVTLLREAMIRPEAEDLAVEGSLLDVPVKGAAGKVLLLPAGRISSQYLAEIEELGVHTWHLRDRSPLRRLLDAVVRVASPNVILLDCRTGFSSLAATVMFHHADMVVVMTPVTDQVWDGIEVLLQAARAAKARRRNRPALLFVPSMVIADETGRRMVGRFVDRFSSRYQALIGPLDAESPDADEPWLQEGLPYDVRVAIRGSVDVEVGRAGTWSIYGALVETIASSLEAPAGPALQPVQLDRDRILAELRIPSAFAEEPSTQELLQNFVIPSDYSSAIDRATALIVGSKGSGKTWLWRYLVESQTGNSGAGVVPSLPGDTDYLIGHAPSSHADSWGFSPDAFKELERDANMKRNSTYKAFWFVYMVERIARWDRALGTAVLECASKETRKALLALLGARDAQGRITCYADLLRMPGISTATETLLSEADRLLMRDSRHVCLSFDGLDTGFETGRRAAEWLGRRSAFVAALLQILLEWRAKLRRVAFKVFLREDIFIATEMQNKSHLAPTTHELRWKTDDIWRIVLNVVTTGSGQYYAIVRRVFPGADRPWQVDSDTLKRLLFPLWGEHIQRGKKAYTASYIERRLSDAADRLFPRTLVQLLQAAVQEERSVTRVLQSDRVLSHSSLRSGVEASSRQRVEDLRTEYVELAPYLEALKGARAISRENELLRYMRDHLPEAASKERGGLHFGAGGWKRVTQRLRDVGVLGPPRRRRSDDDDRLEVALLYRAGLNVRWTGLR